MEREKTLVKELKRDILHQLLYSEIFQHPLSMDELSGFLSFKNGASNLGVILEELSDSELIQQKDGLYFVFEESDKIKKRKLGAERAQRLMPKANKIAQFINKFPFIEGVGISGSLSKGVLHDDADFDFFIITKPGRLWVARTLLILYKKIFLLNSRKYFCVNYFIDSNNLEVEEKNRFTAVEISTLVPASGQILETFYQSNRWVEDYFPNTPKKEIKHVLANKPFLSRFASFVFKNKFGNWADEKMMQITFKRWNKKFGEFDSKKFDLTMKSRKYISKHHPNDFQSKVLNKHNDLISDYKKQHQTKLKELQIEL